jgi:hypothetical protein
MTIEMRPREPGKRKTAFLTIDADNRDAGKRFLLTEMSATHGARWFLRLVAKLARENITLPPNIATEGLAALQSLPLLYYLSWIDDDALVGELMACVQAWPDGAPLPRKRVETDTEEIGTLIRLPMEVIALMLNFSLAAALWSYLPALAVALEMEKPEGSSTTQTSPGTSPLS